MTINERVSPERLNTIKSWRETYGQDANVMIPASEAESIISELQQYRAAASKPIFFVDIEGDDWITAGRMGDWPAGVDDANAGRWPGCMFDFNDLPDGRVPLYAAPQVTSVPEIGEIRVGRLPTMNQDEYPGLGDWWVQLRIGEDYDEVLARVYGATPQEASTRAEALANLAATAAPAVQAEQEPK
ncbi:hypothetical protein FR762_17970 [Enterobacter sp. E76]|nr:hypothetical protein FR762_17970 [Enterobacter sp. E76]